MTDDISYDRSGANNRAGNLFTAHVQQVFVLSSFLLFCVK